MAAACAAAKVFAIPELRAMILKEKTEEFVLYRKWLRCLKGARAARSQSVAALKARMHDDSNNHIVSEWMRDLKWYGSKMEWLITAFCVLMHIYEKKQGMERRDPSSIAYHREWAMRNQMFDGDVDADLKALEEQLHWHTLNLASHIAKREDVLRSAYGVCCVL